MDRRDFLKKSALTGAGFVLAPALKLVPGAPRLVRGAGRLQPLVRSVDPSSPETPAQVQSQVQATKCLWGAFAQPQGLQKPVDALLALENMVGRKMSVHRDYLGMDDDILGKDERWLSQRGTIPYRSFHAWTGSQKRAIQWSDIAVGKYDSWLLKQATDLAQWGQPMFICFHHEPEDDTSHNPRSQTEGKQGCGSPTDFVDAFMHVRAVFGIATNLTWLVSLMAPTFQGNNGGVDAWMPPPPVYDVVGVDGYNRYPCSGRALKAPTDKFVAARKYAMYWQKGFAIPEWGCVEQNSCNNPGGDPQGKAKWISAARNTFKSWPELLFVSYSHENDPPMNFRVDTSTASRAAFAAAGHDPAFS